MALRKRAALPPYLPLPLRVCLWILLLSPGSMAQVHADVTLKSLLKEMIDYAAAARWPEPAYTCRQASSYDRSKLAPDRPGWFGNNDQNQFVQTETHAGRTEKVMLDTAGPGCLVRFWLTSDQDRRGILRIYLDDAVTPTLSFPSYSLLSPELPIGEPLAQPHPGSQAHGTGGSTLYLPIPYAKQCKVTWEEQGQGLRFYQINYRSYPPGVRVKTFTRKELEAARPEVQLVNKTLLAPPEATHCRYVSANARIAPQTELALPLPPGSAAIRRIELELPADLSERALRSLILQMSCDGEETIWCPVSDFFGSGVGINAVQNWYTRVQTDGNMVCRWVMPYHKAARLTLVNLADQPVSCTLHASVSRWSWDQRSLHFHAVWHRESGMQTPPPRDWNYVRIQGKGIYRGDVLALYNPVPTWYGEGDEKIWVDGESFPSHLGTGTEDYYNYSFAPQPVHHTPFSGEPRLDQPMTQGHSANLRTRCLDGIPFQRSLQFDIELISWKPTALTYAATTFWYAAPGASSNVAPQPRDAALPIPTLADAIAAATPKRRSGAVECETMPVLRKSGDFFVGEQDMEPFGGERWSNGRHLLGKTTRIGDRVDIEWLPSDTTPQHILLYATQAPDYGRLRFYVNGEKALSLFDGYAPAVQPAPALDLGVFKPKDGKFILTVEVEGANTASVGARYYFGLDCVVMKPEGFGGSSHESVSPQ